MIQAIDEVQKYDNQVSAKELREAFHHGVVVLAYQVSAKELRDLPL